jgi:outer membrane scaffolding protein for murein synthesis (MipA/OmpV family)
LLTVQPSAAQDGEKNRGDWSFELGLGAMYEPDYEGSDDYEVSAVPVVEISWKERARLTTKEGPAFLVTPLLRENFSVELGVGYEFGREEDDNDALKGLGDLDVGAVALGQVTYELGPLEAGIELTRDISGDRDGMTATVEVEYAVMFLDDRLRLSVSPYLTWANKDYMKNTFGISAAQSAASSLHLAQYDAGSGLKDGGVGFGLGYQFTERISAVVNVEYSQLLGDAADSPLVKGQGSENQFEVISGITYQW